MTEQTHLFHTTNVKAATALLTLGFPKIAISKVRRGSKDSIVFWFNSKNEFGEDAADVYVGMTTGGDALSRKDPENVINYLRCYASNRDELIDDIHKTPRMVEVEIGGQKVMVSEHASEETKRQIAAMV